MSLASVPSWIHRVITGSSSRSSRTSRSERITYEALSEHDHKGSAWLGLHGKVYDVTGFIEKHPGGAVALLREAGKDGTAAFEYVEHSEYARGRLGDLPCLGRLEHRSGVALHRGDGGWQCCLYLLASALMSALCVYVAGSEDVAALYGASADWGDFAARFARLFFDAEVWLQIAVAIPGLYLAILSLTVLAGRFLYGIDYTDVPPGQVTREVAGNAESLLAYVIGARAIFLLDCWEWEGTAADIVVAFLVNNVVLTFSFWANHWAWHRWPALYKIVHRKHHLSVKCTPFTTLSDQWLESALTVLLLLVPPALLGPVLGSNWVGNVYGWYLNVAWVIVLATLAHSQIPLIPLDHISHHILPRTNLSFVTFLTPVFQLDFLFGTWKYAHQDGRVVDLYGGKIVDRNLAYGAEGCEPVVCKALNRLGNSLWRSYAGGDREVRRTQGVLVSRTRVSDTLFHLELQLARDLRLSAGQHVSLACQNMSETQESWNASENHARHDAAVRRSYTPTSTGRLSKVDLLVRHYPPDEQRGYQDGGRASRFLVEVLEVGGRVGLSGPYGQSIYSGGCRFLVGGEAVEARYCVALVAGSGVTPALALLHELQSEGPSSRMEEYMLLHVVGRESGALPEGWYSPPASSTGASRMSCRHVVLASDVQRMAETSLGQLLTQPAHETVALVSGPPGFVAEASSLLHKLGYSSVVQM